jgi:hypothetical protein
MTRRLAAGATILIATIQFALLGGAATANAGGGTDPNRYLEAKGVVDPSTLPGGGPMHGNTSVLGLSGDVRYAALPVGSQHMLERIDATNGSITRFRVVHGGFTIPTVAIDGSASGLSADGKRLALMQPLMAFPQSQTRLEVVNAQSLRTVREITLRGSFSFDAISPDGSLLYLIQFTSPTDPTRYLVRAYDVDTGRLRHDPVVDPDEKGRPMTGRPITRAMSPDGRWAYTLYDGSREGPFIHALDTANHSAVCVDLDSVGLPEHLGGFGLTMSPDGIELAILDRKGKSQATMDRTSFAVAKATDSSNGGHGISAPWVIALAAGGLVAGAAAMFVVRRRRGRGLATGDA